ncbi:copper resistance CopC family protein [Actinomadura rudentiformis]|uniref:Copper resistance protein CopC n=1 Tax=Actinomadura rudentiformis TaxID=359158 RepID=A0A6H9YR23_9ACTN|nr:copper resistance protein CopC [Actinomadura rudentiformis]KAB2345496.1 copper resistance protein CopC [Actinomadura rudentiformis]
MITTHRVRARRAGLVTALLLVFGAVFAAPALAHTRLISSTPGKDATAAGVNQVELVFSDTIRMAKVLVKDGKGKEFQSGEATRSGPTVTQKLNGALPAGTYTVAYAVVGEDGHRIENADLRFTATEGEQLTAAQQGGDTAETALPTTAQPMTDPPTFKAEKAAKESGSGGGATWIMIVVGLLVGIGIGVGIVLRAKSKHGAGGE